MTYIEKLDFPIDIISVLEYDAPRHNTTRRRL